MHNQLASCSMYTQDESGFLLASDIPASSAAAEEVLREAPSASNAGAGAEAGVDMGKASSFKILSAYG